MQTTVKTLFEKGYNKTQIAKMLEIDRKTVRKVLKNPDRDSVIEKKPHPSMLDEHREFILTCLNRELTAQRIFQDLQFREDFTGSYSTVRDYVRKLRGSQQKVYMVINTLPGEESQVDFGYIGSLTVGGKRRKAWIFIMTLSYSRYMFVKIVFDQSVKTFINCHVEAFKYFGGVPETVVIDNLKAGIIDANFYEPIVQRTYAAFAAHYGFFAQPCRVYVPTDKGKVERTVDYVKENCFKGRDFKDEVEASCFLSYWLDNIANVRTHGTTKKQPAEVFETIERAKLKSLNPQDFIFSDSATAILYPNCHFAYKGNYYSAPFQYIGNDLDIIEVNNLVKVYFDQKEIALHTLWEGEKGYHTTNKNHYPDSKNISREEILSRQREEMAAVGQEALSFFDACVRQNTLSKYGYRSISGILALRKKYDHETLNAACARAHYYNSFSYATVRRVCEKELKLLPLEPMAVAEELPGEYARDLNDYLVLSELGVIN